MHPLRSGRAPVKPAPAEHSDDDSDGPLALWAQWQRGQPPADVQSPVSQSAEPPTPVPHQASVRLGQCFVAWVPGLLGSLLQSFGLDAMQSASSAAAAGESFAQSGGPALSAGRSPAKPVAASEPSQLGIEAKSEQRQMQDDQHPAGSWLAANLVADLSVGSLQVLPLTCT